MVEITYFWINLIISMTVLVITYIYSIKIYSLQITFIAAFFLAFFVLIQIFTGFYSIAEVHLPSYFTGKIGNTKFLFTDPIYIFPSFFMAFELGRFSLNKMRGTQLTNKDILFVSLLVSFYGVCIQPLGDLTAAAVGYYYYLNPPEINIFGYPVYFLLSFSIYGLFAFIFLIIERKRGNKPIRR